MAAALLLSANSAVAAPAPEKETARTKSGLYVTATEAYEMLTDKKGRKVVLIDVRDPVEVMFTGNTEMADAYVPLKIVDPSIWDEENTRYQVNTNRDFVSETVAALEDLGADKDTHVIFMCRSGSTRSGPAADALYGAGYENVYTMVDGFEGGSAKSGPQKGSRVVNGWKNSGLPWRWKLDSEKMYVVVR
jgi:rhodanese-related sulfurtransferase